MSNLVVAISAFMLGAIAGGIVTWLYARKAIAKLKEAVFRIPA